MAIELKMPALSPTMEEGTLARWLVKPGDAVSSGDVLAEIETDKATMEFEAVDEGRMGAILVAEGTDGVKVGELIALLVTADEEDGAAEPAVASTRAAADDPPPAETLSVATPVDDAPPVEAGPPVAPQDQDRNVSVSPLARRVAAQTGVDLAGIVGSGSGGHVVLADLPGITPSKAAPLPLTVAEIAPAPTIAIPDVPHEATKLSGMRRTIARRLTESKQQVPHIYLTVDVRLDALLKLRAELNGDLAARGVKLSVNDMLIKALAAALVEAPACNVMFAGDRLVRFARADIAVAVSIPNGLITPIVTGADTKSLSAISTEMHALGQRAKDGKLQPEEYQGGTASLSNMGMFGIRQFDAVINPPQGMIMAIGAGDRRPWVVGDQLAVATVLSATGSFDHRAIDGADAALLMSAFRRAVETPLSLCT